MKTSRILEDLKARLDIVDFISGYVSLKRSGQNWKGICPFHSEKTPSFTVSQTKQIFHCFGCGAGGDIIAFTVKYENLPFSEAVDFLAKKAGISIAAGLDKRGLQKDLALSSALEHAARFYSERLKESGPALEYLRKRGISEDSISLFNVGYAPAGWSNLLKYLRSSGFSDASIRGAGLAVSGDKGLYDMFRHRIMFPISSTSGHVIAFGGRSIDGSNPKYINSPETSLFKKSDTLFGLHAAKEEMRRGGRAIIVEGYLDVLMCSQYGFRNAVAPLGTSLTAGHIQRLRNFTDRAVLVFDGDSAGRAAAKRSIGLICRSNFSVRVLLLPEGEDPDSYLRKFGGDSFRGLLEEAKTPVEFLLAGVEGEKVTVAREVLAIIAEVRDPLIADEMLRELSEGTRLNEATLRDEFGKIRNKTETAGKKGPTTDSASSRGEEYLLLSAVIAFPEKAGQVLSVLDMNDVSDKTVVSLLKRIGSLADGQNLSDMLDDLSEEERRLVTKFSVDPGFDLENVDRNIEDCFRRIERRKLDERIRLAEDSGDLNLINNLIREKKNIIGAI